MSIRKKKTETPSKHSAVLRDLETCESRVQRLEAQLEIASDTIHKLLRIRNGKRSQN